MDDHDEGWTIVNEVEGKDGSEQAYFKIQFSPNQTDKYMVFSTDHEEGESLDTLEDAMKRC